MDDETGHALAGGPPANNVPQSLTLDWRMTGMDDETGRAPASAGNTQEGRGAPAQRSNTMNRAAALAAVP